MEKVIEWKNNKLAEYKKDKSALHLDIFGIRNQEFLTGNAEIKFFKVKYKYDIYSDFKSTKKVDVVPEENKYLTPYLDTEVLTFQTNNNITFPDDFFRYLVQISKYTLKSYLGYQPINLDKNNIITLPSPYNLGYRIRHIGCGYHNVIVIDPNSEHYGKMCTEEFAGDGGIYEINDNFCSYAINLYI